MMLVRDLFGMSLHNLFLHKTRSILTSLGVIFGVGSVIAMLAISEGAKFSALAQIEAMGTDKIMLYSIQPTITGTSENSDNASVVTRYGLTQNDIENICKMDNVKYVTSLFDTRNPVLQGIVRTNLKLIGCDIQYLSETPAKMIQGRWFSPLDYENCLPVCVIGSGVKRKLFKLGETRIIGHLLSINEHAYRIIGIFDNEYGTQYPGLGEQNDMILIPMTTARALFRDYAYVREGRVSKIIRVTYDFFFVKMAETSVIDNTSKRIATYMRQAHGETKDWDIIVPLELLKQKERTQNIFTIVMASIAGISLLVGGIGIMNIMFASVYERRKEIGTRRALGAQKIDILLQFLLETVFLTSLGGCLGILTGVGIAKLITLYSGMPTIFTLWSILLSMIISSCVGVIFGTYPAWQAAQQNPITVLRAE